jgi:hypothetical protein
VFLVADDRQADPLTARVAPADPFDEPGSGHAVTDDHDSPHRAAFV